MEGGQLPRWGPWRLCGCFTGRGTGGICGPLLAQTQVTALLLGAASMLYLLGHPGFPQTLTPEARLPWGGGMQAWRTEVSATKGSSAGISVVSSDTGSQENDKASLSSP